MCLMKKFQQVFVLFFCLGSFQSYSQEFSELWEGHFSYYDIKDVTQGNNIVYAAAENAIFSYDLDTFEIKTITTLNGLSGEVISTIHYSEVYNLLIVGYQNGLINIYSEINEDVLQVVDILNKANIDPGDKRINHFNEHNGVIFISTDYGISVYDLERLEFGDTYFVGNGGSQVIVSQTTIFGDYIYAACQNSRGLIKALVNSDQLIDYQVWSTIATGNFIAVEKVENTLFAVRSNKIIYSVENDVLNQLFTYVDIPNDVRASNNNLLVTTKKNVFVYDFNFNLISNIGLHLDFETEYSSSIFVNNEVFIGTKNIVNLGKTGFGVLKVSIDDLSIFTEIHPQGPLLNSLFSIELFNGDLWGVSGGYSVSYNFNGGLPRTGISHFKNDEWINIRYDSINNVIDEPRFLSHIAVNPLDTEQVYISSYYSGLIEIKDNQAIFLHDESNSTLDPFVSVFNLTLTSYYDRDGALWVTNGRVDSPLNKFINGQWNSYDFTSLIDDPLTNLGFSNIVQDENSNTLFFGSLGYGIIGFNENNGNPLIKNLSEENGADLPSSYVRAIALDNRNQLWLGLDKGLRVVFNTSNFFTNDNVEAQPIIILEDGIPKELLEQQFISDIKVDGSNNKWIATIGAGLFYFSSNGQETIYHFTKDNSPLPSNNINDVSIDNQNGLVYIATDRGLLSFSSGSSSPQESLADAFIYPNPVRPKFDIVGDKVKIKDISENVNIKITDIEGNLVAEAESRTNLRHNNYNLEIDGGTAYWNGKNLANNIVASGVYLVMISDLDTFETRVLKLMVVR